MNRCTWMQVHILAKKYMDMCACTHTNLVTISSLVTPLKTVSNKYSLLYKTPQFLLALAEGLIYMLWFTTSCMASCSHAPDLWCVFRHVWEDSVCILAPCGRRSSNYTSVGRNSYNWKQRKARKRQWSRDWGSGSFYDGDTWVHK